MGPGTYGSQKGRPKKKKAGSRPVNASARPAPKKKKK